MVIPVCNKCQNPVKLISTQEGGLEIIHFQCLHCQRTSASFLLGYFETEPAQSQAEDQRAKHFSTASQQYKLRAKIQGFQSRRAGEKPRRPIKPRPGD
jgi:hypothetical protein